MILYKIPRLNFNRSAYMFQRYLVYHLLISLLIAYYHSNITNALFISPGNARIEWSLEYITSNLIDYHLVEEFVDQTAGNVRLRVMDVQSETEEFINYFRVNQPHLDPRNPTDDHVVMFNNNYLICRSSSLSGWTLKYYSKNLQFLNEINKLDMDFLEQDRTAIGSSALLQLVTANANLLKFEDKVFDESILSHVYIFQATFTLVNSESVRLVCIMPFLNSEKQEPPKKDTPLSDLLSTAYPKKIGIITFGKLDSTRTPTSELLDGLEGFVTRMIVSYDFIQHRSASKHLGVKFSSAEDENPYKLPSGLGCGAVASNRATKVEATQFSGVFMDREVGVERFVAFDETTRHLRIDLLGSHRLIYNLKEPSITYINEEHGSDINSDNITLDMALSDDICVASYLGETTEYDAPNGITKIQDVIGFGEKAILMYLGTERLEDGSICRVYEREIIWQNIPLLLRFHRKVDSPQGRIFLVFYFVQEFQDECTDDVCAVPDEKSNLAIDNISYKSMWLKRIKLTEINSNSVKQIVHSDVQFSQFTWTLDAMPEGTSYEELLHPVRVFDTIVCNSDHEQYRLDFVVKRETSADSTFTYHHNFIEAHKGAIEEALMILVTSNTYIPRSQINQLTLDEVHSSDISDDQNMLVRAKIAMPSPVKYRRALYGWTDDLPEELEKLEKFQYSILMSLHEYTLHSAFSMNKLQREAGANDILKYFILFCPRIDIVYPLTDISALKFIKKNLAVREGKPEENVNRKCEVHEVSLMDNQASLVSQKYSKRSLEASLLNARFVFKTPVFAEEPYTGIVLQTSANRGVDEHAKAEVLKKGYCYTLKTSLINGIDFQIEELTLEPSDTVMLCHRACGLHMNCKTYSYHSQSRTCTLSNIDENKLDQVLGMKADPGCTIYQPNALYYYTAENIEYSMIPKSLTMNYYLIKKDLVQCANLCRANELREVVETGKVTSVDQIIHCDLFLFMPRVSVCAILDKQSLIYKTEVGVNRVGKPEDFFSNLLGEDVWINRHTSHRYDRDYEQYFDLKNNAIVDINSFEGSDFKVFQVKRADWLKVGRCLLECSMLNKKCVMFDYCESGPISRGSTEYCIFYSVVYSDQTEISNDLDVLANDKFSNNKITQFMDLIEEKHLNLNQRGCYHYQMKPDYLLSKRAFLKAKSNSNLTSNVTEYFEREDEETSSRYDLLFDKIKRLSNQGMEKGKVFAAPLLSLMLGLIMGAALFIYQPLLQESPPVKAIGRFASQILRDEKNQFKFGSRKPRVRSNSILELKELDEV